MSALAHMHRHGVVHGDIKPENIVCFTDGKYPHIAIIDCEFCHRPEDTTWTPAGTPNFASPEIYFPCARVDNRVTTAADIWSAGIVLYNMTFLRSPIDNSLGEIRRSHFNICVPKGAPPRVAATLRAMLRVDPQTRITAEDARLMMRA
jgi:serine/threonine protein kinase